MLIVNSSGAACRWASSGHSHLAPLWLQIGRIQSGPKSPSGERSSPSENPVEICRQLKQNSISNCQDSFGKYRVDLHSNRKRTTNTLGLIEKTKPNKVMTVYLYLVQATFCLSKRECNLFQCENRIGLFFCIKTND